MTIFYPHLDELESSPIEQKLEVLLEAAERYKAAVLDTANKGEASGPDELKRNSSPKEIEHAFNWEEIAKLMREIRDLNESTPALKSAKALKLRKLAEIYEVLRGAKMPKLEAVRIALSNEANQLGGGEA